MPEIRKIGRFGVVAEARREKSEPGAVVCKHRPAHRWKFLDQTDPGNSASDRTE